MPPYDLNVQDSLSEQIQAATYYIGAITLSDLYIQLSKLRRVTSSDIFLASDRNNLVDTILLFLHGLNQLGANVPIPILRKVGSLVKLTLTDQNDAVDGIELIAHAMFILGVPMGAPKLRKVRALDIKSSGDHNQLVDALWMMYYIARDWLSPTFEGGPTFHYDQLYEYVRLAVHAFRPGDVLSELFDLNLYSFDVTDSISENSTLWFIL